MKKIYTSALLFLIVILVLSSCNNKIEDIIKGPVTLTFSTFYEEDGQIEAYNSIIEAFEATHENIKIKLQYGASKYDEKIKTSMDQGNGPDIIGLQRSRMLQYIKQEKLEDISSLVLSENLKDKYFGVSLGYGKYDNKYYGIGDMPYIAEWYYNVDMFKKANLTQPTNINELISVCNKLKTYTSVPIMVGFKDPWAVDTFFGMITAQTIDTDKLSRAYESGDKNEFVKLQGANEAVTIVNQLVKSGAINNNWVTEYDYAQSVEAFVKGKAAILPMGSWAIDKIEKMKPKGFNYKAFDNPVIFSENPNSKYGATSVQVITINKESKSKKEAMEFMGYLFSEEAQKIFAEKAGISGFKSANPQPNNEIKKQLLKHLEYTDEKSTMYIDNVSSKMMEVTGDKLLQMIDGRQKPSETWELIVNESHT